MGQFATTTDLATQVGWLYDQLDKVNARVEELLRQNLQYSIAITELRKQLDKTKEAKQA